MLKEIINNWKTELSEKRFRNTLLVSLIFIIIVLTALPKFLEFNELRKGFSFNDPFLFLFNPVDVTWLTFLLIYGGLISAIVILAKNPKALLTGFQSYTLLAAIRMLAMYSLPLDPPAKSIPLEDPFVQIFASGQVLMKDLFFSGHTSIMFLFFLVIPNKKIKPVYLVLTIIIGACVLIQHTHYTVDVIAAPFFAYGAYRMIKLLDERLLSKSDLTES